jgi:hypothetical protein
MVASDAHRLGVEPEQIAKLGRSPERVRYHLAAAERDRGVDAPVPDRHEVGTGRREATRLELRQVL